MAILRPEYPRPDFVRGNWLNLNGSWKFSFDDADRGIEEKWYEQHKFEREIQVPFAYEAKLSGIGDPSFHDVLWYERSFSLAEFVLDEEASDTEGIERKKEKSSADVKAFVSEMKRKKDIVLHFGAVDYIADIYLNGSFAGHHEGGDAPFSIWANPFLTEEEDQRITVRVFDPCKDETIPRGKQFWKEEPESIWYTPTSGIWQTVWLEAVPKRRIDQVKFVSHFDDGKEEIRIFLNQVCPDLFAEVAVSLGDELFYEGRVRCISKELNLTADLIQSHIFRTNFHNDGISWTPEHPNLFDVQITLKTESGDIVDCVNSYFGFRKIHTENHMIYLNNKPYYQRLVLDQGYWPEGLLTAPSDEALKFDIEASKALGFNGCRKHQKAEDPRFLYWADRLGYLVWGECASIPTFGDQQIRREMSLWSEIIERDFNHPSIVVWVPINESWGIPNIHSSLRQQHYAQALYHFIHAADETRLVISNDGWEAVTTDITAIHNYEHGRPEETARKEDFEQMLLTREELLQHPCGVWDIYAQGFADHGAPIVLSEYGGIGFDIKSGEKDAWGYTRAADEEQFVMEYDRVTSAVLASKALSGFCYTQLTDVEQEVNGLLTYDRKFKCDPEKIRKINTQYRRYRAE